MNIELGSSIDFEGNTVYYSRMSEKVLLNEEKELHRQGLKYGHLTAIYCQKNVIFHPLVMVLQRIADQILFLNDNSLMQVSGILSVPYFITDTEPKEDQMKEYGKKEVIIWGQRLYLYTKAEEEFTDLEKEKENNSCLFMTSGTTGVPDIVFKKLSVLEKEGQIIAERLHYTKEVPILVIAPPYHAYCNAYACFAAEYSKATVTYMGNISTKQSIRRIMQKGKYSIIISTPFYFDQLLDVEQLALPRLRVCSGGALTSRMKKSKIRFNNAYGSTETGAICIEMYENGGNNEDVGSEYSNVNVFFDNDACANKGCISVKSGHLMYKRIHQGKEEFINDDRWDLNDIGFRDAYGNIVIIGRNDSIVNIAGEKVALRKIEDKICEIPNIKEAKVKAETDKNNNTYIIAYIVLVDQSMEVDIRKELLKELPISHIPRKVIVKEALLKTSTGKVKENQE